MKMSIGKHTVKIQNIHYENHVRFETLSASCIWLQTSLGAMPRYSWACDQTTLLRLPTITEHTLISLHSTRPTLWESPHLTHYLYSPSFFPKVPKLCSNVKNVRCPYFYNIAALFSLLKWCSFSFFFHEHSIDIKSLVALCTPTGIW